LKQVFFSSLKTFIGILVFIFSAIFSTYFYFQPWKTKFEFLVPGIIYTSATIIVLVLMKRTTSILNLIYYYCLMVATYFAIWVLTLCSSYFAFIIGILTAGIGALVTFILVDKFIVRLQFNKWNVFIIGGISFLLTEILIFSWNSNFEYPPILYIFKLPFSNDPIYGEVIFFWQLIVGTKLVLTLRKAGQ
jgi:hypothetical protein